MRPLTKATAPITMGLVKIFSAPFLFLRRTFLGIFRTAYANHVFIIFTEIINVQALCYSGFAPADFLSDFLHGLKKNFRRHRTARIFIFFLPSRHGNDFYPFLSTFNWLGYFRHFLTIKI